MSENNDKDNKEWLQTATNWAFIIESVFNIISHVSHIYHIYSEETKDSNTPNQIPNQIPNSEAVGAVGAVGAVVNGQDGDILDMTPSFPLNPPEDVETEQESETCKICLTNKIRTVNFPCGHPVFCFRCSGEFIENNYQHKCPICRQDISEIRMIYL